jgi:hypothetical protein
MQERKELGLVGLLPSAVTTLDEQVKRSYAQYQRQASDLRKNVFLTLLRKHHLKRTQSGSLLVRASRTAIPYWGIQPLVSEMVFIAFSLYLDLEDFYDR